MPESLPPLNPTPPLNAEDAGWESRVNDRERDILRELAEDMRALADRPIMAERRRRWMDHNSLLPVTPLLLCDPEAGWREIIPESSLECRSPLARHWERRLREEIYHGGVLGDDYVVEARFDVPVLFEESDWGRKLRFFTCSTDGNLYWDPPLKEWSDLEGLTFPELTTRGDQTADRIDLARELFGDVLEVEAHGQWWWTLGLTNMLVFLRGHGQIMLDIHEAPDQLHRLMAFLRDGMLARLERLEREGLLSPNTNGGGMIGSGGLGYSREIGPAPGKPAAAPMEMWGFAEVQDLEGIRPEQLEEFIVPYQEAVLEKFGLNCFGCCEAVELRWSAVRLLPRLRRVSVSPWADREAMAVCLDTDFIYSLKANPLDLTERVLNADYARIKLRADLAAARGCRLEIILRDTHTLGGRAQNLLEWVRIAREEIERLG